MTAIDTDLDRILVTFGMDDDRPAVYLTRFVAGGDLVMRAIDLGDVVQHTTNVLAVHDRGADLIDANHDRAAIAVALREAGDRIAASVVPLERAARAAQLRDLLDAADRELAAPRRDDPRATLNTIQKV